MIDRSLNYGRYHIEKFLKISKPFRNVLDLGAGRGTDLLIASTLSPDVQVHAVEAYPPYIFRLKELGIKVHSLNIEHDKLPFDEETVDIIIVNQVLEHTKEVFWIFHEITRVLPIGGKIILGVPNLASLHNRLLLLMGRQPSPIKTNSAHVRGFTKSDVLSFLDSCFPGGYALRGFGGSNFYPFPPFLAKPLAKSFPTMAWGIFMLLEKRRPYNREFLDFPVSKQLETNFYLGEK